MSERKCFFICKQKITILNNLLLNTHLINLIYEFKINDVVNILTNLSSKNTISYDVLNEKKLKQQ